MISELLHGHVMPLLREYGVLVVGVGTALESMGVPAPGESLVIAAAIYAAETHQIDIFWVVAAAAGGAIVGDNVGYLVGRLLGLRLLVRYGSRIGLTASRLKLGRYLFSRHGAKVVFFGRFVAVLRTFAALLAGANRMDAPRFILFNAAGGCVWAATYGFGAYLLGHEVRHIAGPLGAVVAVVAIVVIGAAITFLHHNEARLQKEAERAFPDNHARATPG